MNNLERRWNKRFSKNKDFEKLKRIRFNMDMDYLCTIDPLIVGEIYHGTCAFSGQPVTGRLSALPVVDYKGKLVRLPHIVDDDKTFHEVLLDETLYPLTGQLNLNFND